MNEKFDSTTRADVRPLLHLQTEGHVRHCKIIGTIGPASQSEDVLKRLILAGLNIARLNFSHGDHSFHLENINLIRRLSSEVGKSVTILQDLQGPKIRCGKLIGDKMQLVAGEVYRLKYGLTQDDAKVIPIDYKGLTEDVSVGDRVMMDDGLLILKIIEVKDDFVGVEVLDGGTLKNRKGVNFPDSLLSLPAMTEKDSKDLLFGIANGVDAVALSFVQHAEDVMQCKNMISALGADTPVIAKIEKISAVEQISEIAKVADGLMVARGDLGVEASVEKVPSYQRRIIEAATTHARPVIIATQMLESMIMNPIATLAETADVANGVLDGADCLMLSGEVASGKYPVRCVEVMASIINEVETWTGRRRERYKNLRDNVNDVWQEHEAIALAACEAADSLNAGAIVCLTLTGSIARTIARWRPRTPIVAISPRQDVIHRLNLVWGVYAMKNPLFYNTDVLLQDLPNLLKDLKIVKSGQAIVITAGIPMKQMKSTNMMKINIIS
ncbi:MAG: pyruvate kinase [Bdellovibrionota bacterium]